jgi:hypothetical protein
MIEAIREGSMSPWQSKPTDLRALLSGHEKQDLIRSLEPMFGAGGAQGEE